MGTSKLSIHSRAAALRVLRVPLVVTMVAMAVLVLPGQSREVFRAIQEAEGLRAVWEWSRLVIATGSLALVIGLCSLFLITTAAPYRREAVDRHRITLEAIAIVLPLLLLMAVALANVDLAEVWQIKRNACEKVGAEFCWRESDLVVDVTVGDIATYLAVATILALVLKICHSRPTRDALARRAALVHAQVSRINACYALLAAVLVIAASVTLVVLERAVFSSALGPVGVVMLFFSVLCATGSLLGYLYDRHQFPALTGLALAMIAWALLTINDNRTIRPLAVEPGTPNWEEPRKLPAVADAFREWLANRPGIESYDKRPYPVYIVMAEGGGLYAAAHAAWTLGRIQDECPAFAEHVFAISGVSGGSLGAAVFAALVKKHDARQPTGTAQLRDCPAAGAGRMLYRNDVKAFFEEDILTPLISAGLFPDFLQRFLPVPVGAFDRGRALEDGFAAGWERVAAGTPSENIFVRSLRALWSPNEDQPALMLNTTLVHSGERAVMAPFQLFEEERTFPDLFVDLMNDFESPATSLAGSIGISARFPFVTPPAYYESDSYKEQNYRFPTQLVDGGYFDNSGILSAVNLAELLRSKFHSKPYLAEAALRDNIDSCSQYHVLIVRKANGDILMACLKMIVLRASLLSDETFVAGDVASAGLALFAARRATSYVNIAMADARLCGGKNCGRGRRAVSPHIYSHTLDTKRNRLPIGWYLSQESLDNIFVKSDIKTDCTFDDKIKKREEYAADDNACINNRIYSNLQGR